LNKVEIGMKNGVNQGPRTITALPGTKEYVHPNGAKIKGTSAFPIGRQLDTLMDKGKVCWVLLVIVK